MFYMGTEFDKENNKQYKTLNTGLKAAEKAGLNLFDEGGNRIFPQQEAPEDVQGGTIAASDNSTPDGADNTQSGTESAEAPDAKKDVQDGDRREVHGEVLRVFNGKLRLRRSPSWSRDAVCGVTMFNTKEVVEKITVDGAPMFRTADGYYISGKPEHVQFIER